MSIIKLLEVLRKQQQLIKNLLYLNKFEIQTGAARQKILRAQDKLQKLDTALISRLKKEKGIRQKMNRFGEAREKILDIIGHRIVVSDLKQLDKVVKLFLGFAETPTKSEMLLRNGKLQFPWLRDYRKLAHKGKSQITSSEYNEAVHMNRKVAGKICEIQIMTQDLFNRAFVSRSGNISHAQFARRRSKHFSLS